MAAVLLGPPAFRTGGSAIVSAPGVGQPEVPSIRHATRWRRFFALFPRRLKFPVPLPVNLLSPSDHVLETGTPAGRLLRGPGWKQGR
jgi:hypothetical protein